jgi:hypothetical protein
MICACGNEVTRPFGKKCEECIAASQNGGRPKGVRDNRQRKPKRPGEAVKGIKIPCLCCGKMFISEHKGNRICTHCPRNRNADYIGLEPDHRTSHHGGAI